MGTYAGKYIFDLSTWKSVEDRDWTYYNTYPTVTLLTPLEEIDTLLKDKCVDNISDNATLYFTKEVTIPRLLLQTYTNYKRCIKIEKADAIVIRDNLTYCELSNNNVWLYYSPVRDAYFCIEEGREYKSKYYDKKWEFLKLRDYILSLNKDLKLELIYSGKASIATPQTCDIINKVQSGEYTKLIPQKVIVNKINSKLEPVKEKDINLLLDLFTSPDKDSRQLGLQLLLGYDLSNIPVTIKLLLSNPGLKEIKGWDSVNVKYIRDIIQFNNSFCNTVRSMENYILYDYNNTTDLDRKYIEKIYPKLIQTLLSEVVLPNYTKGAITFPNIKFKVIYEE